MNQDNVVDIKEVLKDAKIVEPQAFSLAFFEARLGTLRHDIRKLMGDLRALEDQKIQLQANINAYHGAIEEVERYAKTLRDNGKTLRDNG